MLLEDKFTEELKLSLRQLKAGRKRITDFDSWTQGQYTHYDKVSGKMQYCAIGALNGRRADAFDTRQLLNRASMDLFDIGVVFLNDTAGRKTARHRNVLKAYDHAIAKTTEEIQRRKDAGRDED